MFPPKVLIGTLLLLLQLLLGCSSAETAALNPALARAASPSAGVDLVDGNGSSSPVSRTVFLRTDFSQGTDGWRADVVGYPDEMSEDVGFSAGLENTPVGVNGAGQVLALSGTNVSAMLFMYVQRELTSEDGIEPGRTYEVTARARMISGASRDCVGPGGSPGDMGVYAGFFQTTPEKIRDDAGAWQLRPDPFAQNDLFKFVADIDNGRPCRPDLKDYARVTRLLREPVRAVADEQGRLHAVIGVTGGFAGETKIFLESIELRLQPL